MAILGSVVKLKPVHFAVLLILFAFALRLTYILIVKTPPISDFSILLTASQNLADGTQDYLKNPYFHLWSYQLAFVVYQAVVLFVTDGSVFAIKLLNCLFDCGCVLFIYLIARKFCGEMPARISALLYAVFLTPVMMSSVLTNQFIATFFAYLAIYIVIACPLAEKRPILAAVLAGLALAFSNLMRPEAILIIVTVFAYYLFLYLSRSVRPVAIIKSILSLLCVYFVLISGASLAIKESGISTDGLKNNFPEWKLVLGLNIETNGKYSEQDVKNIINSNSSLQEKRAMARELIGSRLKTSPKKLAFLFLNKLDVYLGKTSAPFWSINYHKDKDYVLPLFGKVSFKNVYKGAENIDRGFFLCVAIFAAIGGWRKRRSAIGFFVIAFFCVSALTFMIIEVQQRYALLILPTVFIMAAGGLEALFLKYKNKKKG